MDASKFEDEVPIVGVSEVEEDLGTTDDWAKRLSELMGEGEFHRFVGFMDGCDDIEFWSKLSEIDAARHPEEYKGRDDFDADEFGKRETDLPRSDRKGKARS